MMKNFADLRATLKGGGADRYSLLAFALVRGMPYRRVELTTRDDNAPSVRWVAETSGATEEVAQAWLEVPATPELLARAATAREAHLAAKRLRGEQIRMGINTPRVRTA